MSVLGEKIKAKRKELGLTLDEVAEEAGCSKSYVWELENKNPPRPSAMKLSGIARALKLQLEYLIGDEISQVTAEDEMFFREYRDKSPEIKDKIRKMIDLWDD